MTNYELASQVVNFIVREASERVVEDFTNAIIDFQEIECAFDINLSNEILLDEIIAQINQHEAVQEAYEEDEAINITLFESFIIR